MELLKSVQSGTEAQQVLKCMPQLKRYAFSLARDFDRAEDLLQDTLQRAFEKLHLWNPDRNMRTWLFTIMHNIHASQARRYNNGPKFVQDEETMAKRSGAAINTDLRDLELGLASLSAEHREIIHLVCVEELKYEEVADILELPKGTVMSRLYRAREQLRAFMFDEAGHLRRVK